MTALNQYGMNLEITPHNGWSQRFWDDLLPAKERVSKHPFFTEMANGGLSLDSFRYALLNFYPLVAHFRHIWLEHWGKRLDFLNRELLKREIG